MPHRSLLLPKQPLSPDTDLCQPADNKYLVSLRPAPVPSDQQSLEMTNGA